MSWLISTAWNRGCKHARFLRSAQAMSFMAAALALVDHCEDYKDRKEVQVLPGYTTVLREACANKLSALMCLRHHLCCKAGSSRNVCCSAAMQELQMAYEKLKEASQ